MSDNHTKPIAVILVSGGLDSATVLAQAVAEGYDCYALSFDYSQRHQVELNAARKICAQFGVREHKIIKLDLTQIGGSALTDRHTINKVQLNSKTCPT